MEPNTRAKTVRERHGGAKNGFTSFGAMFKKYAQHASSQNAGTCSWYHVSNSHEGGVLEDSFKVTQNARREHPSATRKEDHLRSAIWYRPFGMVILPRRLQFMPRPGSVIIVNPGGGFISRSLRSSFL